MSTGGLDNVREAAELLREIARAGAECNLPFLVIGGLAVVEHGYGRTTEDMDLMIRRADRPAWTEQFGLLGYREWRDGGSFVQYEQAKPDGLPLDAMLVSEATFTKLHGAAVSRAMLGVPVLIPCLNHLLALKLHALRHTHGARGVKDMGDIVTLIENNRLDVTTPEFRAMCDEFGTNEAYESIQRLFGGKR